MERAYIKPQHHIMHTFQSTERTALSTVTILNRVMYDLNMSVDDGHVTRLVLLDVSSAFYAIDHETLLRRFQGEYGLTGTVLIVPSAGNSAKSSASPGPILFRFLWSATGSVQRPILVTLYACPCCQLGQLGLVITTQCHTAYLTTNNMLTLNEDTTENQIRILRNNNFWYHANQCTSADSTCVLTAALVWDNGWIALWLPCSCIPVVVYLMNYLACIHIHTHRPLR